jgi:hypothetical protein
MAQRCRDLTKAILSDAKFDINVFLTTSFSDYWTSILEHLRDCEHKSKRKGQFIKRPKYVDSKGILAALSKVVPRAQPSHYRAEVLKDIDTIFRSYFHPATPNVWRSQAIQVFFYLIRSLPDHVLATFSLSIASIVPYTRFAVGDSEKGKFEDALLRDIEPIVEPSQSWGTGADGAADLQMFLALIQELWNPKGGRNGLALELLCNNVLFVIYKKAADELGIKSNSYGFANPPDLLHDRVVEFMLQFSGRQLDIAPLVADRKLLWLLVRIARQISQNDNPKHFPIGLELLTALMIIPAAVEKVAEEGHTMIGEIGKVAVTIGTCCLRAGDAHSASLDALERFCASYFGVTIEKLAHADAVPVIHSVLIEPSQEPWHPSTIAWVFFCLCHHISVTGHPIGRDILRGILRNSYLVSVVARYVQYLATYAFPVLYSLNVAQAREQCLHSVRRKQRTKQSTPYDFVAESIDDILDRPHEFAISRLQSRFPESQAHDPSINKVRIPAQAPPEDLVCQRIFKFIDAFDWEGDQWTRDERRAAATVTVSFAATLIDLRAVPPGIEFDRIAAYRLVAHKMFAAVLDQGDTVIRRRGFSVLATLINETQMRRRLSDEDLSRWYGAIILEMMEPEPADRDFGFLQAVTTLRIGLRGSGLLVPVIMSLVEADLFAVGESLMSFVSSLPLLSAEGGLSSEFLARIEKEVKNGDFLRRAVDQLGKTDPQSLRARAIAVVRKLRASRKWGLILPVYSVVIVDELTNDAPDKKLLAEMLGLLIEPLQQKAREALSSIRSLLMFSRALEELIPDDMRNFVADVASHAMAATRSDDPQWTFQVVKLTGDLFIHTHKLHVGTSAYAQFARFLIAAPDLSFPPEVTQVFTNVRELLTVFYGRYPFPDSVFCPAFVDLTFPESPVFVGNETTAIRLRVLEDHTQVVAHTGAGQFSWKFTQVDDQLYEIRSPKPFSVPLSSTVAALPPPCDLPQQTRFASVFNDIVDTFEVLNECTIPEWEQRIPATVRAIDAEYEQVMGIPEREFPIRRPLIHADSSPIAALESCGLCQGSRQESIVCLDSDEKVGMVIKRLQTTNHRARVKIGVIFVLEGQTTQNEILSISYTQTSMHFREFITGLGWPVLLESHIGYDGGLDCKNERNGTTSIYYTDFTSEVMFHIAPLIPTDPSDPQQIYKKRHIGNDHIHIVWCESGQEYDPATITSQFNQAHIIIYPLDLGLFRVETKWRSDLAWFGPLRWPVVVKKRALPSLVRATAIAAMDTFYRSQSPFSDLQTEINTAAAELVAQRPTTGAIEEVMRLKPTP